MVIDDRFSDLDVAIVDDRKFGGTCVNYGCIPSKMLSYTAQILSIAPNATGFVCTLAVCVLSDGLQARGPFVVASSAVAIAGYAMVLTMKTPAVQYTGTVVVAAGLLPSAACQLAWMGGTFGGGGEARGRDCARRRLRESRGVRLRPTGPWGQFGVRTDLEVAD